MPPDVVYDLSSGPHTGSEVRSGGVLPHPLEEGAARTHKRLWNPYILVFVANACLMVIELVASRMSAIRVGVSLYTWTAIIGVILAGVSLGNLLGGRLADRRASAGLLGAILALASLASLAILWLNNDLHDLRLPETVPYMAWVLLYVAAVYGLPGVLLGAVSPIVVRLSLLDLRATGRTVGQIGACATLGSIVGTFATGFALIALLGTKNAIMLVSGVLMLLALWLLADVPRRRAWLQAGLSLSLFGLGLGALARGGFLVQECLRETNYFCIKVQDVPAMGRTVRELLLDRLVHSYSDIDDPTYLAYGYERAYAGLMRVVAERKPDLDILYIGGGGYTFPRYMEATWPASHQVVAEIDPGVTEAAHLWLGLPRDTRVQTYALDARNYLSWHAPQQGFDIVFGDAFNDFSVPFHLTTLEFDRLVARSLRSDGLYLVNIIDGGRYGRFLRAFVRTLQEVFTHVTVIPSTAEWREVARTTFVIAASQRPLDLTYLPDDSVPLSEEELRDYLGLERPLLLTDDHVPVDNLMAPVVEGSFFAMSLDPEIAAQIFSRVRAIAVALLVALLALVGWLVWRCHTRRSRSRRPAP